MSAWNRSIFFATLMNRHSGTTTARLPMESFLTDSDRFDRAVRQIVGKRLTWAEVTGKVGEIPPVN